MVFSNSTPAFPALVWRAMLDLLFPPRCTACDRLLLPAATVAFCAACAESLVECRSDRGAFAYGGQLAHAIERLKYRRKAWIAGPLGRAWGARLDRCALGGDLDLATPVPLHFRRLAERGFDQAALLARGAGIRPVTDVLVRIRHTPPQARLPARQRRHNVAGAFVVRSPERVQGKRVLILDDVITTGATIRECTRVLLEAGAKSVVARALAVAA